MQGLRARVGGRTVAVVGLGRAGLAAGELLARAGARLRFFDEADAERLGADRVERARALGEVQLGPLPEGGPPADLVVVSPGVRPRPWEAVLERAGVPVVSDVEVAAWALGERATVLAVTGTNGKSTVTTVLGAACARTERPTFVGGNLGRPAAEAAGTEAGDRGFVVLELSSFQLARTRSLRADVAVLTSLAPDHLDWHGGFEAYAAAKGRLFAMQRPGSRAVLPWGDAACARLHAGSASEAHFFGEAGGEVRLLDDALVDEVAGWRIRRAALRLVGRHQQLGLAAAALAARLGGVGPEAVVATLRQSEGLPHRMQPVGTVRGVRFVDDSKATNVAAAVAALRGLREQGPVVLLAGGRPKGEPFEPLGRAAAEMAHAVVVFGEAAEALGRALHAAGARWEAAESLARATERAFELAAPGGLVLLSPACASFDAFDSYAARGEAFARQVGDLALRVAGEEGGATDPSEDAP